MPIIPYLRNYSWNSDVNTNLVISFTLWMSNVLLSWPAVHNQSTTALHQAENTPNVLLTPNNGTMPFALFYRDLTSVVDSCVEAVEKVVTGGAAVGGAAVGSLRGGGGNWRGSSVAVGYADVAARGSWVEAAGTERGVEMGAMGSCSWWGKAAGDEQADDSER